MAKSKSSWRTVYTGGPTRKLQTPIYGTSKLPETRIANSGIKVSRKPDIIGAPKEK